MNNYAIKPPVYTEPDDHSVGRVQTFTLVDAKKLRRGIPGSTPAWELTFKIPSLQHVEPGSAEAAAIESKQISAGMQIALYGVNETLRVGHILSALKDVPTGEVAVELPARDGPIASKQKMTAGQAIAHTVDITHPTKQLLEVVGIKSNDYDDMPLEDFLQLPGVKGKISFDDLCYRQPPLQNRKYTPSRVDLAKGEISVLVSEVHHTSTNPQTQQKIESRGTTTGYLSDLAERFTQGERGLKVSGLLDTRKHKLPYHQTEGPRIFLSTGVGIAPHVSWLRECDAAHIDPNVRLMLSGERSESDHLLDAEIKCYLPQAGAFQHVYSQPAQGQGQYVDAALLANGETVWKTLHDEKGSLFLCGKENMEAGVEKSLIAIGDQYDHGKGKQWLAELKQKQIMHSMSFDDRFYKEKWPKIWDSRQRDRGQSPS